MGHTRWTLAWAFWSLTLLVAAWGAWDAPRRGETGVQMRGERIGSVQPGSMAQRQARLVPGDMLTLPDRAARGSVRTALTHMRSGESLRLLVRPA